MAKMTKAQELDRISELVDLYNLTGNRKVLTQLRRAVTQYKQGAICKNMVEDLFERKCFQMPA